MVVARGEGDGLEKAAVGVHVADQPDAVGDHPGLPPPPQLLPAHIHHVHHLDRWSLVSRRLDDHRTRYLYFNYHQLASAF